MRIGKEADLHILQRMRRGLVSVAMEGAEFRGLPKTYERRGGEGGGVGKADEASCISFVTRADT